MDTSNHTGNRIARCYNLTPAGSRLATYLFYVEQQPVTPDVRFGDFRPPAAPPPIPPEQHDDDWQPPEFRCTTCGRPLNDKGLCWFCDEPGSGFFDDDFEPEED